MLASLVKAEGGALSEGAIQLLKGERPGSIPLTMGEKVTQGPTRTAALAPPRTAGRAPSRAQREP